jgi:hypothetical protein
MQSELRHRRPIKPLRLRRCFAMLVLLLEVSNLLVPLIWSLLPCLACDCSSELPAPPLARLAVCIALWCSRAGVTPMSEPARSP